MKNPLFDPEFAGYMPGVIVGVVGALYGVLLAVVVPKGNVPAWVLGVHFAVAVLYVIILFIGVVCYVTGKPPVVAGGYTMAGAIGTLVVLLLTFALKKFFVG
ncbi:MAG: hypothetical protein JXR37_00645 [Kiritimatiellae bacterium]|nr:hypothetical protein [Kiritimatiellia bacterium]